MVTQLNLSLIQADAHTHDSHDLCLMIYDQDLVNPDPYDFMIYNF